MVIKTSIHPTEDLQIQASHIEAMVKELSQLPTACLTSDLHEPLEELTRYAHYHLLCVSQFLRLNNIGEEIIPENCNDILNQCLVSLSEENTPPSQVQVQVLKWFKNFQKDLSFSDLIV